MDEDKESHRSQEQSPRLNGGDEIPDPPHPGRGSFKRDSVTPHHKGGGRWGGRRRYVVRSSCVIMSPGSVVSRTLHHLQSVLLI